MSEINFHIDDVIKERIMSLSWEEDQIPTLYKRIIDMIHSFNECSNDICIICIHILYSSMRSGVLDKEKETWEMLNDDVAYKFEMIASYLMMDAKNRVEVMMFNKFNFIESKLN
ncbi:hypothetical protein [Xenorhabdus budapestensis]|uniref:Uncharacterized protein n=1 Tax=Xenorhabdus budapestensis TaxID=290110 RepID=A0A2D0IT67_XENBU|nr:hypothetical protein [Xenorhabdus budapestensis]PHM25063.1 hypothetical protein Xbud_03136 [Xenorhabdus budapestensis]